jgi:hypothetical protein
MLEPTQKKKMKELLEASVPLFAQSKNKNL